MPKTLLAALALLVGGLQAWDAGALRAETSIQGLILAAVLLPPFVIALTHEVRLRGAAVAAATLLLVAARMLSPTPLPELTLAGLFGGVIVLVDHARTVIAARSTDARGTREHGARRFNERP